MHQSLAAGDSDKMAKIRHWLDDGVGWVAIQEAGFKSDLVPPSATMRLGREHHLVGTTDHTTAKGQRSVALAINHQWDVAKVFRHPSSCRCIAVELQSGGFRMFVGCAYLKSGLDTGSESDREEACTILEFLREAASPYQLAFIAGDMNCTLVHGLDRGLAPAGERKVRDGNPLRDVLLYDDSVWTDTFRRLHPDLPGHTRKDARLDYILAKLPEGAELVDVFVDALLTSDHRGVECGVSILGSFYPQVRQGGIRPIPRIDKASPTQLETFRTEANRTIQAVMARWDEDKAWAGGDKDRRAQALTEAQSDFARVIVETAHRTLPQPGPPRRDEHGRHEGGARWY